MRSGFVQSQVSVCVAVCPCQGDSGGAQEHLPCTAAVSQAALVLVLLKRSLCVPVCCPGAALRCPAVGPSQVRCAGHGEGSQDG